MAICASYVADMELFSTNFWKENSISQQHINPVSILKCQKLFKQANSENYGPPLGNKFYLEVGQRSRSRSRHGTI